MKRKFDEGVPNDIWLWILSFACDSFQSLANTRLVSKKFASLCKEDDVCKNLYLNRSVEVELVRESFHVEFDWGDQKDYAQEYTKKEFGEEVKFQSRSRQHFCSLRELRVELHLSPCYFSDEHYYYLVGVGRLKTHPQGQAGFFQLLITQCEKKEKKSEISYEHVFRYDPVLSLDQ